MSFRCPRIANGLSFNYDGTLDVCAARRKVVTGLDEDAKHGTSADKNLTEFLDCDYRQSLIHDENNDRWPTGCESCMNDEIAGKTSLRQSLIKQSSNIRYLHISMSNICDSDCVMCGPAWSSKIAARLHKHPDTQHVYLGSNLAKPRRAWQHAAIRENMQAAAAWADHIHVVGGEPMIDPDLWQFLNSVDCTGKTLSFVTNLNSMPSQDKLAVMLKYEKASMTVSIDAVGITHEWIRQGVSWHAVLRNIICCRQAGISVNVHCTVQAHGLQDLAKHYSLFARAGLQPTYDLLQAPALLQIKHAPIAVLEDQIAQLDSLSAPGDLLADLNNSLSSHQPDMLGKLIAHTGYLNQHRQHRFNTDKWQVETR